MSERFDVAESVLLCELCALHTVGNGPIPFSGPTPAYLAIVGEAPGKVEDAEGLPFVGPSGQLLRESMVLAGLAPEMAFFCNAVSCLRGSTRVRLADGKWEQIQILVAQRYDGKVLSVAGNGELVHCRVNGWYRNDLSSRQLLAVSYNGARRNRYGASKAVVTQDHLVLTTRGWVEAGALKSNDAIATGVRGFSPHQRQVLLAGRIGDGKTEGSASQPTLQRFTFHDSEYAYAWEKATLFGMLPVDRSRNGSGWIVLLSRERALTSLPTDPLEIVRQLDDVGVAAWYMDDGHFRERDGNRQPDAQIAVCRFPIGVVQTMASILRAKGYSVMARKTSMGPRLFFGVLGTRSLSHRIAPYVVPSMAYKLMPADRHLTASWSPEGRYVHYAPVSVTPVAPGPHERSVYCLGVEGTENFITPGGVVHNCFPDRTPDKAEINLCGTNLRSQLEVANPRWVLLLGGVALSTLRPDLKISRARGHLFTPPDVRWKVFVTFHPSYALRNGKGEQILRDDLVNLRCLMELDYEEGWSEYVNDACVICGVDLEDMAEHDLPLRIDAMGATYCDDCYQTKSPEGKAYVKEVKAVERIQVTTGHLFK